MESYEFSHFRKQLLVRFFSLHELEISQSASKADQEEPETGRSEACANKLKHKKQVVALSHQIIHPVSSHKT